MATQRAASRGSTSDLAVLGEVLREHGYSGARIQQALKETSAPGPVRSRIPVYRRRLADDAPLSVLILLFALGLPAGRARALAALGKRALGAALASGILQERPGGDLQAAVAITEYDGLHIVHDRKGDDPLAAATRDFVLGPNPAATTLAVLTPREPVGLALDVGCGSGVQALLAARHSERVIATDINPRALRYAAMSGQLSGATNVEWREGDLLEPARGERFDLVVANPPFIVSPDSSYLWRDGGVAGGGLNERLVRELPGVLAEGGMAVLLLNWPAAAGEAWDAPLRRWLDGAGCDAWMLLGDTDDPLSYAATWTEIETAQDGGVTLDRWVKYFRVAGIEALHFGPLLIRRRSAAANWIRSDLLPGTRVAPAGEHLLRAFRAHDLLVDLDDATLLAGRISVPKGHVMEQLLRSTGVGWELERLIFRPEPGIQFPGALDGDAVEFLMRCDGKLTVREALGEAGAGDPSGALAAIRRMLALGFVEFIT